MIRTCGRALFAQPKIALLAAIPQATKMPITEADIEKIALLAHLEITDEERKLFAPQISEIVTYVEQLNAVDTGSVEPALGGLTPEGERTEAARDDEVQPSLG